MAISEAARAVADWEPDLDDPLGPSARELARTLEAVVKSNPEAWTSDPSLVVRTLREPVYVKHYLRGVAASAKTVAGQAPHLIRAVTLVRAERWDPRTLGRDSLDFEPDWSVVDTVSIEVIDALAHADADLAGDFELCWDLAVELATNLPENLGSADRYDDVQHALDPFADAINTGYGTGLRAVLALGGWEHRMLGAASGRLDSVLTQVLTVGGAVGLQLRSVIAASRPFVEAIASDWMAENYGALFGDALGLRTLDQTLKYTRPSEYFFSRSRAWLFRAAHRGTDHAAAWLVIAYLRDEPRYSFEVIVDGLAGNASALGELCREIARLSGDQAKDQTQVVDRGIAFWERLLAEPPERVPPEAMCGLGWWALTSEVEERRWLELTEETVTRTGGPLDMATEVAERCRDAQPSASGLRILFALVGHGETWEQHHIAASCADALRRAADCGLSDPSFTLLKERLIQRGYYITTDPAP